ncbi:MAG: flagellar biosynthetic protein FliR [Desulfovibrionaceae bacterium]
MLTLPITVSEAQHLLLIVIRLSIVLFMLPFFDGSYLPKALKGAIVLLLSFVFLRYANLPIQGIENFTSLHMILLIVQELLLGLSISLCINFLFTGIRTGVEFLSGQMGFSMAQTLDPTFGITSGVLTNFFTSLSIVVFLLMNGHLILIKALADSFVYVPVGKFVITGHLGADVLTLSSSIFSTALKISAPVFVAILLIDLSLALIGKANPTMNLLMFGFPIKIGVGLLFLTLLFGILTGEIERFILDLSALIASIGKGGT